MVHACLQFNNLSTKLNVFSSYDTICYNVLLYVTVNK